jgi:iron(III) transport system substrate-binding protein
MKHFALLIRVAVSITLVFFLCSSMASGASTAAKQAPGKKVALPDVPIKFDGDTDATIIRRAQWIEGAKKEGALVWWENLEPDLSRQIIAEFNKVYPFIKVTYWRSTGEGRAAKIDAEFAVGKTSVDVGSAEFANYARWRKIGLMEKFTDIIPGVGKWHKGLYGKYGDWAYAGSIVHTPMYNTNKVSAAEAPKSWEDLLDPKWKGKVGMVSDMKTWEQLAVEDGGWGVEKTTQYLTKLAQQKIIWGRGRTATHALLVAGEMSINVEGNLENIISGKLKGEPVDWVRSKPVVVAGPAQIMQKKAPHPNAARLFYEWLMSPQGQLIYEKINEAGIVYPGAKTEQAKLIEGLPMIFRTEEGNIKAVEMGLTEKFAKILGLTK